MKICLQMKFFSLICLYLVINIFNLNHEENTQWKNQTIKLQKNHKTKNSKNSFWMEEN